MMFDGINVHADDKIAQDQIEKAEKMLIAITDINAIEQVYFSLENGEVAADILYKRTRKYKFTI